MYLDSYDHIIWDWNGTLLDDAWLCQETINSVLSRRSMPNVSQQQYQEIFGFPVIDYYRKLGFDFETEPFEVASSEFISGYEARRSECHIRTNGESVLRAIQARGIGQSIISSSQHNYLVEAVEHLGLTLYFDSLSGLDNHHAESKIGIARNWLQSQPISASRILFVGDTLHDLETAKAISVDCCLIHSGHQSVPRLTTAGVPILNSLGDLLD